MRGCRGRTNPYPFLTTESHSAGSSPQIFPDSSSARTLRIDPDTAHSLTTPSSPLTAPSAYGRTEFFEHPQHPARTLFSPQQSTRMNEPPSHTLFVRNLCNSVEEKDIRRVFGPFGEINNVFMSRAKTRGYVMVTFFDIRNSMEAAKILQNTLLHGKRMDIHYGIPKDNPSEEEQNNGTLFVRNLDASVTEDDIRAKFSKYGEIREIRDTPGKRGHRFVEFYDTRDAKNAMDHENNTLLRGNIITIELSRPGGRYLRHGLTQCQPQQQMFEEQPFLSQLAVSSSSSTSAAAVGGSSFPPPPTPLERQMAALSISSAYSSPGRTMPLSVPDSSQLEPQAPQHSQLFVRSSRVSPLHVEPYSDATSTPPSYGSRSAHGVLPSTPPVDPRIQSPILKSSSAKTLGRQIPKPPPMCQPPVYSPPMNYSPNLFTLASDTSGVSSVGTSTPLSTVDPSGFVPLGSNYPGNVPFFHSVVSSSTTGGGARQSSSHHRASLSTPSHLEFTEPTVVVEQSQLAVRGSVATVSPLQRSPLCHGSSSSSPSPVRSSSAVVRLPTPTEAVSEPVDVGTSTLSSGDPSYDVVLKDGDITDSRTTLYIKNIPHRVNPSSLLSVMMAICPSGFRFLYLPNSKQNPRSNNGYAFIKLTSTAFVPRVVSFLNNRPWPQHISEKICEVKYATVQSFQGLLKQFDTTPLLSDSERWPPFVLYHGDYVQLTPEIFSNLRNPSAKEDED